MAQPRGRRNRQRGSGRGGGYSQRQSRQPAQRGARGQSGYGARSGGGGPNHGPIIAVIAIGGVAIVAIVILLIMSGKDDPRLEIPPVAKKEAASTTSRNTTPRDQPPKPLTPEEKARIKELVDRLDRNYATAKELKNEGFRAHDEGDRELAQRCFQEARGMLQDMIGQADILFEQLGNERVERYYYQYYEIQGKWSRLLADFLKHIE